jgi:hypothetical protein
VAQRTIFHRPVDSEHVAKRDQPMLTPEEAFAVATAGRID